MGVLGVPCIGRRFGSAIRASPTSHGTAFAPVEVLDSHGFEVFPAEEVAAALALVAAHIVWNVPTVPAVCAYQGDSGALLVVASLGLPLESEALMAYTTAMLTCAACDARVSLRADAAALLKSCDAFVLGDASLTFASIRDDAAPLG